MSVVKIIGGLALTDNGQAARPWLRGVLVILSFIGVVSGHWLTGTPLDSSEASTYVQAFIETGFVTYFAHAFYNSAFRR